MPRTCTVCAHDEAHAINVALVHREPYRAIARQYGVTKDALQRHSCDHLPKLLVEAKQAVEAADADDLLGEVRDLQTHTLAILEAAEATRQHRTALGAIREARSNLELLAKLLGELDERPVTNILISAEWATVRTAMMEVLGPYSQARVAVAERLAQLEGQ
jgi:hypothetical protein